MHCQLHLQRICYQMLSSTVWSCSKRALHVVPTTPHVSCYPYNGKTADIISSFGIWNIYWQISRLLKHQNFRGFVYRMKAFMSSYFKINYKASKENLDFLLFFCHQYLKASCWEDSWIKWKGLFAKQSKKH